MSDEDNVRAIPPRPGRPPVEDYTSQDARKMADQVHQKRLIQWKTEARQDALIIVERARERVGLARTAWTPLEADTLHAITDLLLQIQEQEAQRA